MGGRGCRVPNVRPFPNGDEDQAREQAVLHGVRMLEAVGHRVNAATRNALRLWAMQSLSGGSGTLVLAAEEHLDTVFTTGRSTSVTAHLAPASGPA